MFGSERTPLCCSVTVGRVCLSYVLVGLMVHEVSVMDGLSYVLGTTFRISLLDCGAGMKRVVPWFVLQLLA